MHGQQPWRFAQDRRKSRASSAGKNVTESTKFHKNAQKAIKQKLRTCDVQGAVSSHTETRLAPRARARGISSPPPPGQGGAHVLMAGISVTRPVMKAMQAVKLVRKMADDAPRSALLSVLLV